MRESRPLFPWLWTIVLMTVGLLVASMLLSSWPRSGPLPDRAVSAANLRGIGQAMHIYAEDNDEWFPIAVHAPPPGNAVRGETDTTTEPSP